jgi:hypothetical protein
MTDNKKYIYAFLITAFIFGTALVISNYVSKQKLVEIQTIENRLSLDILSSETQFSLLEETSCKDVSNTSLSQELGDLSDKVSAAESQYGADDPRVASLKEYYSLLEIKDYLLMKSVTAKCGTNPTFILYFYSNQGDCPDCQKTGYVLDALHDQYPDLRIYSFDYNLSDEAISTLERIYNVTDNLPALVINGDPYYGFRSLSDLQSSVPALKRLEATATTTSAK